MTYDRHLGMVYSYYYLLDCCQEMEGAIMLPSRALIFEKGLATTRPGKPAGAVANRVFLRLRRSVICGCNLRHERKVHFFSTGHCLSMRWGLYDRETRMSPMLGTCTYKDRFPSACIIPFFSFLPSPRDAAAPSN